MAQQQLLDLEIIASLRELGESTQEPLLADLTRIFLETGPQTLSHLRNHLSTQNCAEIVKSAHSLKSSSSALGLLQVQRLASTMENAARNDDLAQVRSAFVELEEVWEPSQRALIAYSSGVE